MGGLRKKVVKINGMHCASCEVLIERSFKKIPGIEKVNVNHASGKCELLCTCDPDMNRLNDAVKEHGYSVSLDEAAKEFVKGKSSKYYEFKRDHLELGAAVLIVIGLFFLLKQLDWLPKSVGLSDNVTFGVAFIIGLVAAVSTCIAVTGGLLVAVTNKYAQAHPNLTGHQKFKPHIYFNIGRIISYTVLGGLLGVLGSVLTLSTRTAGILTVAVSLIMVVLGMQLLNIFPFLKYLTPKMPKFLAHKIYDASTNKTSKSAPFLFGALTFFLPCGFTQALQLYVLGTGSFVTGAATMFFFSLGTLPALVSLGAVSSFAKGTFQRYFVKVSAIVVILLGVISIKSGLVLTVLASPGIGTVVATVNDQSQIIEMKVMGLDYFPKAFTIKRGVPVEWKIDGRQAQGCAGVLAVPSLGITRRLSISDVTVIRFTPEKTGSIKFSCGMGMAGPGVFNVI
jgi:sulfite exporter TauE/SafE/copper chaperone CopZ